MAKISVLIVDDHQIFRQGLRDSLSLDNDLQVVGEAATVSTTSLALGT